MNTIKDILTAYMSEEISIIKAYTEVKKIEKELTKEIENAIDYLQKQPNFDQEFYTQVKDNPIYNGFELSHSIRTTYNYADNKDYSKKKDELKYFEKMLKDATIQAEKGKTLCNEDGIVIDPVSTKSTTIYTVKTAK